MPTPVPKASSFPRSLEMFLVCAMVGRQLLQAVSYQRRMWIGESKPLRHVFHHGGHRAFEIGELPVGEPHPAGGADGHDRVAFQPQHGPGRAEAAASVRRACWHPAGSCCAPRTSAWMPGIGHAEGVQDRGVGRIGVHLILGAEHRQAVHQAAAPHQPRLARRGASVGDVGSVEQIPG